jgi:hypothetical protein
LTQDKQPEPAVGDQNQLQVRSAVPLAALLQDVRSHCSESMSNPSASPVPISNDPPLAPSGSAAADVSTLLEHSQPLGGPADLSQLRAALLVSIIICYSK